MASYLKSVNPYPNFVVVHTHSDNQHQDPILNPLLGFEPLDGPSMQIANVENINNRVAHFINQSAKTKNPWVVMLDEIGEAWKGVMPDEFDQGHDTVRHMALWGSLMAGAGGSEWYFGYRYPHNDLMCEDFRSREGWWKQTKIAHDFFLQHLPFAEMTASNELLNTENAYCLSKIGKTYAVYLPKGGPAEITLPAGKFSVRWFNPRIGGKLVEGTVKTITGGGKVSLGRQPLEDGKDWVVLINSVVN
jgi:hypothetical protein